MRKNTAPATSEKLEESGFDIVDANITQDQIETAEKEAENKKIAAEKKDAEEKERIAAEKKAADEKAE